ncbi:MAG: CAP domain-containing protein [Bryobacteraceae bacterium]
MYEVGPGRSYTSIGAVPWATLQPGDIVRIHHKPDPYREKWVICRQGTSGAPITVSGVPGPAGELPVIEGSNAVTAPGLNYWSESRGIIKIGGANTPADTMPQHIIIEGLEVRGARSSYTFKDDSGSTIAYSGNAATIFVEKCQNCTIRNCVLHDAGNILFVASSDEAASRNILIQGNHIYDGGHLGSIYEHNVYTAAVGITFEGNRLGRLSAGAGGNNLKDRSAGTVIRYNWIEGGNRQLDLVDGEDSSIIRSDPSYRAAKVYGNVLIEYPNDGNRQMVHYGGDGGNEAAYRKGVLYFYNNTLASLRTDRTTLFRVSTNDETVDARNNIFYTSAAGSTVSLADESGWFQLSHNWIKPGWVSSFGTFGGTVSNDGTMVTGSSPGFVDEAGEDYRLNSSSQCVNAAGGLNPAVLPAHSVALEYVKHLGLATRHSDGLADIGAFEFQPAASVALDSEEWDFLALLNNYRAQNGAGPLQVSATLQQASEWMSNDMASKNYVSHTDSLGRSAGQRLAAFGYSYSPWGENIAAGNGSAQNTLNQWANACDPDQYGQCTYAHRQNMLNPAFRAIGIGRAYGAGSTYGWYWTTDFGGIVDQPVDPPAESACDLSQDGTVNVVDVQRAVNMALGLTPCTANINGDGVCNVVTVQRVVNGSLGGGCLVDP